MNAIDRDDTAQKIAEIREALDAATPGPWEIVDIGGIEIAKDYKYKDGKHIAYWIAEMYQDEDMDEDQVYADAHLIANAPEWLGFLLSELDKRDERIRKLEVQLDDERNACYEALEMLNETRRLLSVVQKREQKLIKTLRFYSKGDNGQRAREVLKEMGVLMWEEFFTGGASK